MGKPLGAPHASDGSWLTPPVTLAIVPDATVTQQPSGQTPIGRSKTERKGTDEYM